MLSTRTPTGRRLKPLNAARDICIDGRDGFRFFSTAIRLEAAIACNSLSQCSWWSDTFLFSILHIDGCFEYVLNVQSGLRDFFFKIDSCFRWCTGLHCTLRQRRHAIRRASKPTIVRRYSLLDTPAVYQRASTPPPVPVVIVLRKRSTASRQEGGREFRSVGSIKERGTNCSIDIYEGPHAWYNKAWARSNRAGQVRGQALSVNQGKWFVKGRARACEIGHACATQRGVFLRLRLRRVCTCLL